MIVDELKILKAARPQPVDEYGDEVGYDVGLICEKGHVINEKALRDPEYNTEFCKECGAHAVCKCECGEPIRGGLHGVCGGYSRPAHCTGCGAQHIWTKRQAEAIRDFVSELEQLDDEQKRLFCDVIPDLLVETPQSDVAALRTWKLMEKLPPAVKKIFVTLLENAAVSAVLKSLGLG